MQKETFAPMICAPTFHVVTANQEDFGRYYIRGDVFMTLRDGATGQIQQERELRNLVVLDAGILVARLLKSSTEPPHGIYALAVGTGDVGWGGIPPAPTNTQRSLYSELTRKTFTSTNFVNSAGAPVAYPTNVVDYTCTLQASEAVGPLVEMGLICPLSTNMSVKNPVLPANGPRDTTVDLTTRDSLINYLTFLPINKPATSTLTVVWRITT